MGDVLDVTFYKRKLPCPPATEFSCPEGKRLFREALEDGMMMGFFKLIEQFRTQAEPAYCGLTSLAMVLNALAIDPRRTWKAPWRWFDETLLDCCKPLEQVQKEGISFKEVGCLAKCNGAAVTMCPFEASELSGFRECVKEACGSGEKHVIVCYSRKKLGQTGEGHFSPIGGFHAKDDQVLILDTARFKYPPHWVPLVVLYEAMGEFVTGTNLRRGYMVLKAPTEELSLSYTLSLRGNWEQAERFISTEAPSLLQEALRENSGSLQEALEAVLEKCPVKSALDFVDKRACDLPPNEQSKNSIPRQTVEEFQTFPLYHIVQKHLGAAEEVSLERESIERLTAFMLLSLPGTWLPESADLAARKELEGVMDLSHFQFVQSEVEFLRFQLRNLLEDGIIDTKDHECCCPGRLKDHGA